MRIKPEKVSKILGYPSGFVTAYGLVKIPSISCTIHHWKFVVIRGVFFIGIDTAIYTRFNYGWIIDLKTKQYAICTMD